jgi:DNA-binding beta-propeller fold protein YncE
MRRINSLISPRWMRRELVYSRYRPLAEQPAGVFTGAPFSKPIDLALSTDNQTVFVTDFGADAILSLNISGSTPMAVPGTSGTKPVALDVIQKSGMDVIYFCGTNSSDGQPAVFEIPASGASSAIIRHKGAPLMKPTGIVSAKDGTLYISDKSG